MAAVTDHDRRDAEHAARAEIAIQIQRYVRRLNAEAYAHIKQEISRAEHENRTIDGTALGREAAAVAASSYLGVSGDLVEQDGHQAAAIAAGNGT